VSGAHETNFRLWVLAQLLQRTGHSAGVDDHLILENSVKIAGMSLVLGAVKSSYRLTTSPGSLKELELVSQGELHHAWVGQQAAVVAK